MFLIIAVDLVWVVLYRQRLLSTFTALGLTVLTLAVSIWLVPYLAPVQLVQPDQKP